MNWNDVIRVLDEENKRQGGKWYDEVGGINLLPNPYEMPLMDVVRVAQLLNHNNAIIRYNGWGLDNSDWDDYCLTLTDVILEMESIDDMKDKLIDVISGVCYRYVR